mmetsp:Transcript_28638/g.66006  ORF Transcript_28638/g.66006 Transcript_28638/m.66006 type:complete len:217 (+) Transcript_28638:1547-2197(+)
MTSRRCKLPNCCSWASFVASTSCTSLVAISWDARKAACKAEMRSSAFSPLEDCIAFNSSKVSTSLSPALASHVFRASCTSNFTAFCESSHDVCSAILQSSNRLSSSTRKVSISALRWATASATRLEMVSSVVLRASCKTMARVLATTVEATSTLMRCKRACNKSRSAQLVLASRRWANAKSSLSAMPSQASELPCNACDNASVTSFKRVAFKHCTS